MSVRSMFLSATLIVAMLALSLSAAEVTKGGRWIRANETTGEIIVRTSEGIQQLKAKPEQIKAWNSAFKFGQPITVTFDNGTVEGLVRGAPPGENSRDAALFELVMQLLASDKSGVKKIGVMNFGTVKDQTATQNEVKADELITLLHHTGRYQVVERGEMDKVLAEDKLAAQGVIAYQSGANLKRKLGIDAVLLGTVAEKVGPDEKRWTRVNARLVTLTGVVLGAASVSPTGSDEASGALETIMADVADQLAKVEGEKGKKVGILVTDFTNDTGATETGMWLAEELITRLAQSGKYMVVERRLVSHIMQEKKLQAVGITESNAGTLLRLLGADAVVAGKLIPQEKDAKLNVKVIGKDASIIQSTEKMFRGKLGEIVNPDPNRVIADSTNPDSRKYVWSPTKQAPDMPKEWKTSSLIDVLNDKDGLRVEGRIGKHFIEVPGLKIKGDFVFEMEYHVYYSDIKVTFSGPGGQSLMMHLDNFAGNVTLIDDQSTAPGKFPNNGTSTVKLTRKDGRYHVEQGGEKLFPARRVEKEPNFDTIRFDMTVHGGAKVQIHHFKIVPGEKK